MELEQLGWLQDDELAINDTSTDKRKRELVEHNVFICRDVCKRRKVYT